MMKFKFSKYNQRLLILVLIFLSALQQDTFQFVTNTMVGRTIFIGALLFVADFNKTFGLIAIAILAFSYYYYDNYLGVVPYEGFQSAIPTSAPAPAVPSNIKPASKQTVSTSKEGFCLSDKECTMLRGKPSNSIPVAKHLDTNDDNTIFPSEPTTFRDTASWVSA